MDAPRVKPTKLSPLNLNGYRYTHTRSTLEDHIFKCNVKGCAGELRKKKDDSVLRVHISNHTHAPRVSYYEAENLIKSIGEKLREHALAGTLLPSARTAVDEAVGLAGAGSVQALDRRLAHRRIGHLRKSLRDPAEVQLNKPIADFSSVEKINGEQWLIYDSNSDENAKEIPRVVIFASPKGLKQLEASSIVSADGTEKICRDIQFAQLYVLSVRWGPTSFVPCVYALLSEKKQRSYNKLLRVLTDLCKSWAPTMVLLDMEVAAKNAFVEAFPEPPRIHYCQYHVKAAWLLNFKKLKLDWAPYEDLYYRIRSLCFVDPSLVEGLFAEICATADDKVSEWLSYLKDNYFGEKASYKVSCWSNYLCLKDDLPRSNSSIESRNRIINAECRYRQGELLRPTMFNVMKSLRVMEGGRRATTSDLPQPLAVLGGRPRSKSQYDRFVDRVKSAWDMCPDPQDQVFQISNCLLRFECL